MNKIRVFSVIFFLLVGFVWGETFTWTGDDDNSWSNPLNWDHGTSFPGETGNDDIVIIDTDAEIEIDTATVLELNTLTIGATVSLLFADASIDTLTVDTLVLNGELTIGSGVVASGTINITNLTVGQNGEFSIDSSGGFDGKLEMDGADVTVSTTAVSITATAIVSIGVIDASEHTVTIASSSGDIAIGGEITAEDVNIDTAGDIVIRSGITANGEVKIGGTATGNISINGEIAAEEVNINSVGDITISRDITANGEVNIGGTATGTIIIDGNINAEEVDIENTGNITISGSITANQEVSIGGATTGAINIDGNINAGNININSTGNVTINSTVDAASLAFNLTGSGDIILNNASVSLSTGNFNTNGVTLLLNTGTSRITAESITLNEVSGPGSIDLTANTGDITFSENVDVTGNLQATTTSGVIYIDEDITTIGNQTYNGNVILNTSVVIDGATVSFMGTLNGGASSLALSITGDAVFDGEVGTVTELVSISVSGNTTLGADVKTAVNQTYSGDVILSGAASSLITLTGTTVTIDGRIIGNNINLTIDGDAVLNGSDASYIGDLVVTGTAVFQANTLMAASVEITGASTISANVTTTGDQTYTGAVTIGGTGTITLTSGGNQTFAEAVTLNVNTVFNGAVAASNVLFTKTVTGAYSLTVTNANVQFGDEVSLTAIIVNGGITTLTTDITTTNEQTYNGGVILSGAAGHTLTGTTITLGMITGDDIDLTIKGNAVLNGSANYIGALVVTGTSVFQANALMAASVEITGASTISANITTTGEQTYSEVVTLAGDVTLKAENDNTITFMETLDSASTHRELFIDGNAVFTGDVGGTVALASISVNGTTALNANVTTTGDQTYSEAVTFAEDITLTAKDNGTNATVSFWETLDSDSTPRELFIDGNAVFTGDVGATVGLASISVSGTTALDADITTTGDQTYTGAITIGGTGTRTLASGGDQTFSENVTLNTDAFFQGTDAVSSIHFYNTVNGANASLTVTGAIVQFSGTVGPNLTTISVTSGSVVLDVDITTTGDQTYTGAITIGGTGTRTIAFGGEQAFSGNITLNADTVIQGAGATPNVIFTETVTGAYSLTVTNANVQFDDEVNLASISVSGTTTLSADITTTGDQSYGGDVTLGGTGTTRTLTSSAGSIEATGAAIFTSSGTVSEMNISAGSSISLPSGNEIAIVNLSSAGNITYNSNLGAGNDLTVTVSSGAASTGSVSITEETGNIVVGAVGIQNDAPQGTAVNLTASNGSVTIDGGIGNATYRADIVITSGSNQDIIIDGAIYSYSLSLLADINNGNVSINADVTLSSPAGDDHDDTSSAMYVTTGTFIGSGSINLTATAWVCVWVGDGVSFIGNVTGDRIHYHAGNQTYQRHIVYSAGGDPQLFPAGSYLYIDAENPLLGSNINFSTIEDNNIYIINIPSGRVNGANTRNVTFSTENGFIEFRGDYDSSGQLNISPNGTGDGVRLDGSQINLATSSTQSSFKIDGTNQNINVVNDSSINAYDINIDGDVSGTSSLELTASNDIIINGKFGSNTVRLGSVLLEGKNIQLNASDIYTNNNITLTGSVAIAGTVNIDTSAENIEFDSVINGTVGGTNTLTLTADSGNILLNSIGTDASRLLGNISIISGNVDLSSGAVFFMPATGGTVSFDTGVSVSSGTFILNGGSATTPVSLEAASTGVTFGDVSIGVNSNVRVAANSSVNQTNGSTLTIEDGAVLDITDVSSSWSLGIAAPNFNFTGNDGNLLLGTNARLITHNLNFNDNSFVINNSGSSYITVTGNADISAADLEGGDYKNLFFEMNGAAQALNAARSLSRLHIKTTSRTTLANNLQIDGEVLIEYPGVLDAGSYNVTLAAILEDTKADALSPGTNFNVMVGRWRVLNAPEDISGGGINHIMRAFLQDEGGTVEFIKHPSDTSGNPVFFEIIGNTVWQIFYCREPGVTFQFSTHEDSTLALHHHVFLYRFDVQVPDIAANNNNYITLTRLTTPTEPYYFYEEGGTNPYKPPGSTASGTVQSSLPTVPVSSSLKADNNPTELRKFWNFNLIGRETESLQIKHVAIFFSHAWYQRVPIASTQMDLRAIPFYRTDDNRGHFNYDWVEVRRIIYSYVEDSNGNGKADRIRVQSNVNINGQFANFNVEIEGFELDRSKGDNGFSVVHGSTGDNDDLSSFYIYLKEGADLYDGKPLKWWVTQNGSLYDSISQQLPVGDPADDENYYTINTIPPRVSYTLTLPGYDETYIRFSQPVSLFDSVTETYINSSNVFISGGRVTGVIDERTAPSAPYAFALEYRQDIYDDVQYKLKDDMTPPSSGAISYLVRLNDKPATADLAALPEIGNSIADWYFELDNLRDMGVRALDWNDNLIDEDMFMYFPSPRYPIDWNYSSYATYTGNSHAQKPDGSSLNADSSSNSHTRDVDIFLPPNRVLTPEMVQKLENRITVTPDQFATDDNRRRVTDVLISRPPEKTGDDNYFAWPVWVMQDADNTNITLSDDFVFDDLYIELSDVLKSDTDIIWNFDGSRNLELRDGYKIKMQSRINNDLSGNLNLFYSLNVPTEYRNPVGNSPSGRIMGSLWLPGAREKNPLFYFVPWMNPNFTDLPSSSATTSLFNFDITGIGVSGQRFEFLFKFDNSADNLFIARLEAPAGTVPQNWYELVRPFGFDIQDIIRQRGGVTILNNVINSNNREVTYLRYNLARAGRVTIQVYTLDGTLVKSLRRNEHRDAGEWTDGWDGTNNGGRPVARGMYFIRIVAPDIDEIRKVMVVR